MNQVMAVISSIIAVAMVTTLILPGRQTTGVVGAFTSGFAKVLGAAMGR